MKRFLPVSMFLASLALLPACRAERSTEQPDEAEEESLVGTSNYEEEMSEEEELNERYGKREELPPPKEPKEVCKGKGKNRTCEMKDPDPGLTAAHGIRKFMKDYRWGMTPDAVLAQLGKKIEAEYEEMQSKTTDPMEQDRNRNWKTDQLDQLAQNHVKFEAASRHKWGVSLIQFEYEDDSSEEMVWVRSNANLRKFFFFKDGELWKVLYAYNESSWPGKKYEEVVEENFKKWFGVNPESKVKQDPETKAPLLRYLEWTSRDGDILRTFDMTAVHGVHVIAVIDGDAERRIGERLPNIGEKEEFTEDVADVLGGSDVCYDADGNIVEDAARCQEILEGNE